MVEELNEYLELVQKLSQKTPTMSSKMVCRLVEQKLQDLERLWEEVEEDLGVINQLVAKIRSKIEESIASVENPGGCLTASVDDFISTFSE